MRKMHFWGGELNFFGPVLLALPPELLTIHGNTANIQPHFLEEFVRRGYDMQPHCPIEDLHGEFVITDGWNAYEPNILDNAVAHGTQFLTYRHATDGYGWRTHKSCWNIFAHQHLCRPHPPRPSTLTKENNEIDDKLLSKLPPLCKEEFAYSGPYHMGEWETKRHTDKALLRQELEEALGRTLPKDKPLVAFFRDEASHEGQLIEGLRALATHATIIYKAYYPNDNVLSALQDVVIPWKTTAFAQNTLRFSVDFILAGYYSGTLATAIMLGLPVVPCYTRIVNYNGKKCSYSIFDYETKGSRYDVCRDAVHALGRSYDIQDTKSVLNALTNPRYLENYYQKLPRAQQAAFGDYIIEGAAQKTAMLIMRAFTKGTFGSYAEAVEIRVV